MVLDKYEKYPGVINKDAVDFQLEKKFDLIFSISTLEHIGADVDEKDNMYGNVKVKKAVDHLFSLLKPNGRMIFSFPLKYNKNLDEYVEKLKGKKKVNILRILSRGLSRPRKEFNLCIVELRK